MTNPKFGSSEVQDIVTVAAINFHPKWGDKADNLKRMKGYVRTAAKQGADLILFPETALTGYGVKDDDPEMQRQNAETVPGESTLALAELSKEYGVYVVLGMPERDAADPDIIYNSAAVIGPEGVIGAYRKIHPAAKESLWATKGSEPLMFDTPWGPVGVGICYDSYCFPELVRYYTALGSRIYLNPTAIHNVEGWQDLYYTTLKSRSLENGTFIVSSNLVGQDYDSYFPGGSMIVGPASHIGSEYKGAPVEDKEAVVLATLDLSQAGGRLPLFEHNPLTGVPDWRPDIYLHMLSGITRNGKWAGSSENKLLPKPPAAVIV
ncbi:carbon-nitrogen hydrolase family protein [Paenibacillus cellulositrophicus]|uniref:carbon-nitrogen hydrolase family protein n=1 Tax=Paenibacillus TaxID=44249 RepID=UPI0013D666DC|nr:MULTISPECIES: carbon-nitrogen hydrolase family protein [Paenibacillus]MCM2999210.1 carbon-nitrogen hydrolase family protein [Paenibacillus cellulositrophicus]